jgi:hypothetical protein
VHTKDRQIEPYKKYLLDSSGLEKVFLPAIGNYINMFLRLFLPAWPLAGQ